MESNVKKESQVYEAPIESQNRYRMLHWAGSEGRMPHGQWIHGILGARWAGGVFWVPGPLGHRRIAYRAAYREAAV